MKKLLLLTLIIACFYSFTHAQEQDSILKGRTIFFSLVPQFVIKNALRVDIEKRFKNSAHATVLSPRIFSGTVTDGDIPTSNFGEDIPISGFGLEVIHKFYINKNLESGINWYQAITAFADRNTFEYRYFGWTQFIGENGFTQSVQTNIDENTTILQYGGSIIMGAMIDLNTILNMSSEQSKRIFLDFYIGFGIKQSEFKNGNEFNNLKPFTEGSTNYGYSGTFINSGAKFGILF